MNFVAGKLESIHKTNSCCTATLNADRDNATSSVWKILLCTLVVLVTRNARICHFSNFVGGLEELCNLAGIGAIAFHTNRKSLKSHIQIEGALCSRVTTKVTHKLSAGFYDVSGLTEISNIAETMVAFIWLNHISKLTGCLISRFPVKVSRVYDCTTTLNCVTIHIFCCRVNYNVCAPFKWTAENWSCKSVIYNKRKIVVVSSLSPGFKIKNCKSRVCNCLTKNTLCIRLDCLADFFIASININPDTFNPKLLKSEAKEIYSSAVN